MRLTATATFRMVDKSKGVQIKRERTGRKRRRHLTVKFASPIGSTDAALRKRARAYAVRCRPGRDMAQNSPPQSQICYNSAQLRRKPRRYASSASINAAISGEVFDQDQSAWPAEALRCAYRRVEARLAKHRSETSTGADLLKRQTSLPAKHGGGTRGHPVRAPPGGDPGSTGRWRGSRVVKSSLRAS